MASYERSYGTARAVFSLLEIVGWIVVGVGAIAVFGALSGGGFSGLLLMPGVGMVISGLISVAFVQSSRANVDTAEMTRDLLDIAKVYSRSGKVDLPSGSDALAEKTARPVENTEPVIENSDPVSSDRPAEPSRYCATYNGTDIYVTLILGEEWFVVKEKSFESFAAAKAFIDEGVKDKPDDDENQ